MDKLTPSNNGTPCCRSQAHTEGGGKSPLTIDADSVELIKLAFRGEPRKEVKPRLKFSNIAPSHITNMASGLIDMLEGFAKSVRKVHMHAEITLSKSQALQEITIACYLADFVEHSSIPITD